jgi:HSP20 family protein
MDLVKRERGDLVEALRRIFSADVSDTSWLGVEEYVDGTTQVVRVEIPGVDPEKDVDISVANGTLRISATKQEKSEHKDKGSYRSEFRYGSFVRSVALPQGCTETDITATYREGVLEVRIPMGETPAPKSVKVPVTRGEPT